MASRSTLQGRRVGRDDGDHVLARDGARLPAGRDVSDRGGGGVLGHALQREQAQLAQDLDVIDRPARRPRALDELLGVDVDELHLLRRVEQVVGHQRAGLAVRDERHAIRLVLQVRHAQGPVHVDAGVQQLERVLVTIAVARAGRVLTHEGVDGDQVGPVLEDLVHVKRRGALARALASTVGSMPTTNTSLPSPSMPFTSSSMAVVVPAKGA